MKRYYEILGLSPGAGVDEVRQAYRDLVRVWHPDRFCGDYRLARISEEKLKRINEAYRELRSHIESQVLPGVPEERRPPPSPDDGEYIFNFYDYDYSPWIWTFKRISDAEEEARRRGRSRWLIGAGVLFSLIALAATAFLLGQFPGRGPAGGEAVRGGADRAGSAALTAASPVPREGEAVPPPSTDAGRGPAPGAPEPNALPPGTATPDGKASSPEASPFGEGVREGLSRIGVENGTGRSAVVVLLRRGPEGTEMVRNFFLSPGAFHVATEVPPGAYLVQAALGEAWDAAAGRFRKPARFATSAGFEVREEETTAADRDGILARRRVSSDIRLSLEQVLVAEIPERAFRGR